MAANYEVTKNKFGVPIHDRGTPKGILMPKLKYRFRVTFFNFATMDTEFGRVMTQNVVSCKRPTVSFEEVALDSYNSKVYVQGKHTWESVELVVRDDITGLVTKAVGNQLQRQLNHFQQTTPAISSDFKFDTMIEVLDGTDTRSTEVWYLEGCFLKNVNYADHDYTGNETVNITMDIRYDNATHYQGEGDVNGRLQNGNPFTRSPEIMGDFRLNEPGLA